MGIDLEQPSKGYHNNLNGNNVSIEVVGARNEDYRGNRNVSCCPSTSGNHLENTGYVINGGISSGRLEVCGGAGNSMHTLDDKEPNDGVEFESKEEAFSHYKKYAESVGFTSIIKSSRRSRLSGSFIDARFVCTRYGSRQVSAAAINLDSIMNPGIISGNPIKKKRGRINRSWLKTDCKACMHVKKREDGRWIVCNFIKKHNHEIFPIQTYRAQNNLGLHAGNVDNGARERIKMMHGKMSQQYAGRKKVVNQKRCSSKHSTSGKHLSLEEGDMQFMLDSFTHMQDENPFFFYALGFNEEQKLRNVFWVYGRGRLDYGCFHDVVLLDTTYIKSGCNLPLALFIGVNHHFQLLLLGCALVAEEPNYVWLMRTWLKAMAGRSPKVILTYETGLLRKLLERSFQLVGIAFVYGKYWAKSLKTSVMS